MTPRPLADELGATPFALGLSAGFFGFFAHAGFMLALVEAGLRPARVTGASAGALVGGLVAAGMPPADVCRELLALRREDFWDPGLGLGLLRGEKFLRRLERLLPVRTFEACPVPLAVSVYDLASRRTIVVRSGPLAEALVASCTFPLLFRPQRLAERWVLDGGIVDRAGLYGMPEVGASTPYRRVLHHHLTSRSPWRRRGGAASQRPRRPDVLSLELAGLPRVSPFALERGASALMLARRETARLLTERHP